MEECDCYALTAIIIISTSYSAKSWEKLANSVVQKKFEVYLNPVFKTMKMLKFTEDPTKQI